jgi:hypothetical protein
MARAPMRSDVPIIAVICILIGDRGVPPRRAAQRHPPAEPRPVRPSLCLATRRRRHSHHYGTARGGGGSEGCALALGWLACYYTRVFWRWAIHRFRARESAGVFFRVTKMTKSLHLKQLIEQFESNLQSRLKWYLLMLKIF